MPQNEVLRLLQLLRPLQVYAIFTTNPLRCTRRKQLAARLRSQCRKMPAVLLQPAAESPVTDTCCIRKIVFVNALHVPPYFSAKLRKISDICKNNTDKCGLIRTYPDRCGQKRTAPPKDVIPLYREKETSSRPPLTFALR